MYNLEIGYQKIQYKLMGIDFVIVNLSVHREAKHFLIDITVEDFQARSYFKLSGG